jgi:hypothetical protein
VVDDGDHADHDDESQRIVSHHQIEVVADPGRNPLGAYS